MTDLGTFLASFIKMRPRLEAMARSRTGSRAAAEDLMQTVWLRIAAAAVRTPVDHPSGFIARVARNAIVDHVRSEKRRTMIDEELAALFSAGVDDAAPERRLIGKQSLHAVQAVLRELPEKTRRIFLMNRIDGITHRKIADALGMTDEAVYYHIRRALERLAQLRDENGSG